MAGSQGTAAKTTPLQSTEQWELFTYTFSITGLCLPWLAVPRKSQDDDDDHHHRGTYLAYADWMMAPHFARDSSSPKLSRVKYKKLRQQTLSGRSF